MKIINKKINDNVCSVDCFEMRLSDFIETERFALNQVTKRYKYDENHKPTDVVEAIIYTVTDERLNRMRVRVNSTIPIIENEEIEALDDILFIKIPIKDTIVRPYDISFGKAKLSIIAPFISLLSDEELEELENERGI